MPVQVSSSSVFLDQSQNYGPLTAIDGILMNSKGPNIQPIADTFFRSAWFDTYPWLQIDYECSVSIIMVMVVPLYDPDKGVLKNLRVYVGNARSRFGEASSTNDICAKHYDLIKPKQFAVMQCQETLWGRHVQIQMLNNYPEEGMALNEVIVFFAKTWNRGDIGLSSVIAFQAYQAVFIF